MWYVYIYIYIYIYGEWYSVSITNTATHVKFYIKKRHCPHNLSHLIVTAFWYHDQNNYIWFCTEYWYTAPQARV